MPGLLRGVARTAVVAGTATSVSNRVSRRQSKKWAAKDQQEQGQQMYEQQPAAAPEAQPISMDEKASELEKLAELRDKGILTDQEFQAQKSAILGS